MSYQYGTIEEYKTAIDLLWVDLAALEGELAAIVSTRDVPVDLTKSLEDFLRLAETKFAEKKATYEDEVNTKGEEISDKRRDLNGLLEECKRFLFDDNTIVYIPP